MIYDFDESSYRNLLKRLKEEKPEKIDCVNCGKFICFCFPFDLEGGTYFFCKECFEKKDKLISELEKEKAGLESGGK